MFMFRVPNYYKYLDEPVINFITDLNALEEDALFMDQTASTSSNAQDGRSNEELKDQNSGDDIGKSNKRKKTLTIDEELDSDEEGSDEYEDDEEYKAEKQNLAELARQVKLQN